jgi:hypothetical protein
VVGQGVVIAGLWERAFVWEKVRTGHFSGYVGIAEKGIEIFFGGS